MTSKQNIRATALQEFWGEEYPKSLYLWQGAKHNCTLTDIEKIETSIHKDIFSSQEEIQNGHEFCKEFYYRILPELSGRLNKVHNLDLPTSFWQMAFGYWLYRHISIIYDKYAYLSELKIDETSIKLLSKDNFYVPRNHIDYLFCFSSDFGVQQLVSQYYYLYKTKDFEVINSIFTYDDASSNNDSMSDWVKKKFSYLKSDQQIVLLGTLFSNTVNNLLFENSNGRIGCLILPVADVSALEVDFSKRRCIASAEIENSFESYFMQTLYYCLPKDFLENFMEYRNVFRKDIKARKFTHIVSEDWISNIPNAIYIAFAKEDKRTFFSCEHGAGRNYCENGMQFIDYEVADKYISIGWKNDDIEKFIQGGFVCRDIVPYHFEINNRKILYITTTKFIYLQEFNEFGMTNSTFVKELRFLADFINLLSPTLKENFFVRPRKIKYLWDVEKVLEFEKNNIKIDQGIFTESILKAKIVIIDHMSTGFAEILLSKVPFLLVYDVNNLPLRAEIRKVIDGLVACGIIHNSPQSAAAHLSAIYKDVEGWWTDELVVRQVGRLRDISVAPANKTTDFLLSVLVKEFSIQSALKFRFWTWLEVYARQMYVFFKKIKSFVATR